MIKRRDNEIKSRYNEIKNRYIDKKMSLLLLLHIKYQEPSLIGPLLQKDENFSSFQKKASVK